MRFITILLLQYVIAHAMIVWFIMATPSYGQVSEPVEVESDFWFFLILFLWTVPSIMIRFQLGQSLNYACSWFIVLSKLCLLSVVASSKSKSCVLNSHSIYEVITFAFNLWRRNDAVGDYNGSGFARKGKANASGITGGERMMLGEKESAWGHCTRVDEFVKMCMHMNDIVALYVCSGGAVASHR